jgi:hypothetical protein
LIKLRIEPPSPRLKPDRQNNAPVHSRGFFIASFCPWSKHSFVLVRRIASYRSCCVRLDSRLAAFSKVVVGHATGGFAFVPIRRSQPPNVHAIRPALNNPDFFRFRSTEQRQKVRTKLPQMTNK